MWTEYRLLLRQPHEQDFQRQPEIDVAQDGAPGFGNMADPLHDVFPGETGGLQFDQGEEVGVDDFRAPVL